MLDKTGFRVEEQHLRQTAQSRYFRKRLARSQIISEFFYDDNNRSALKLNITPRK